MKIINILIEDLSFEGPNKPFILNTIEVENTTALNLFDIILPEINLLHTRTEYRNNFKLFITDRASYCILLGTKLKEIFSDLLHVTCICHALHNLCETIREKKVIVLKVTKLFSKAFNKSKRRKNAFKAASGLSYPKLPINTRWGSYISYVIWFCDNYQAALKGIEALPKKI